MKHRLTIDFDDFDKLPYVLRFLLLQSIGEGFRQTVVRKDTGEDVARASVETQRQEMVPLEMSDLDFMRSCGIEAE